ncbi:MAG: hypothetical protein EPO64_09745 [Nitrospirae bacterium]|nr:MAG: hypothetical protein EPO64_09745 [Nitrospirota bacterium]
MPSAIELWGELCGLLSDKGVMPLEAKVLTPAEIARAVRQAGLDGRVERFVWNYLYPRHYGGADGEVSETEAIGLVDSLKPKPLPSLQPLAPEDEPEGERCGICHVRPARGVIEHG